MSYVKIVEVSPRDGLQNETQLVPAEIKIKFIDLLSETGLSTIEATSFVSEKKIPQLADHDEVMSGITMKKGVEYPVLIPNIEGFNAAINAGAKNIAVFGAASETFSQRNINCSIDESLQRFELVLAAAKEKGIPVRAYISCCLGCPFEGKINPEKVANIADKLFQMGCYEISLGDTIGIGTANQARELVKIVSNHVPISQLAAHFHNTYGQALANLYAVLEEGISIVDSSVSGLGGCPYAKGATGNVASEDVLYMLNGLGITTNVDLDKLISAGQYICNYLNKPSNSRVAQVFANS